MQVRTAFLFILYIPCLEEQKTLLFLVNCLTLLPCLNGIQSTLRNKEKSFMDSLSATEKEALEISIPMTFTKSTVFPSQNKQES